MNFIGTLEGAEENVELKYCERCGGLFLRTSGAGIVYCAGCTSRFVVEPDLEGAFSSGPRRRSRGARLTNGPKGERKLEGSGRIEHLQGVATGEVWSW